MRIKGERCLGTFIQADKTRSSKQLNLGFYEPTRPAIVFRKLNG